MELQRPKGTRDFLPEEMARRRRVFDIGRRIFEKYGYGEVQTPAFENIELFEAKGSIGGDAVKDIYRFEDKSCRKLALRFDPTTPIARIVASQQLQKPVKWYYNFYPSWRYEDTRKGRYRELYQSGAELIGPASEEADAEIITLTIEFVIECGIKDFYVRLNSRKILDRIAEESGIDGSKMDAVFRMLDKLDKKGEKAVRAEMKPVIGEKQVNKLFTLIGQEKGEELEKIREAVPKRLRKYVKFDPTIARGLDYYTGFILETIAKGKEDIGSIASGGRYDDLIGKFGGQSTPAVGVGIGVDRILDIIGEQRAASGLQTTNRLAYVVSVSDSMRAAAAEITASLREQGIAADSDLMGRNFGNQMKYAGAKATVAVIIGEKDWASKKVTVKDLMTGSERKIPAERIAEHLKNLLR